jgi:hypothetical protein
VDVLFLETALILTDDVQIEIFDANFMQIIGNVLGALQRRRQIVDAFHGQSPGGLAELINRYSIPLYSN